VLTVDMMPLYYTLLFLFVGMMQFLLAALIAVFRFDAFFSTYFVLSVDLMQLVLHIFRADTLFD